MVEGKSSRCGLDLNVPVNAFASTSNHAGKPRCSAAASAPLIRSCVFDASATETTSPALTW